MTSQDIVRYRLASQQISATRFKQAHELVKWMGAMQAQDYLGAKWAIGLRLPAVTDADVEQALADRKIVRTWPQRGTLHFIAPEDTRWRLALSAERILARARGRHQQLELDDKTFETSRQLFADALRGGNSFTRAEMLEVLERGGIATQNQRGYHILGQCALTTQLCFGALRGKQQTFVLLDEWLPKTKELSREESLARLAKSYFISHGPATIQDLAWWSSLTLAEIRIGLESVAPDLHSETLGKQTYWMSKTMPAPSPPGNGYLLPGFDEYLLGYKDRSAILNNEHVQKVLPGGNGIFVPTVLLDGRVAGIWKRAIKKSGAVIALSPFSKLDKAQLDSLKAAAERYSHFIGLPVTIS